MGHWMIRRATGVALLREDSPQQTACLACLGLVVKSCLQVLREMLQESQASAKHELPWSLQCCVSRRLLFAFSSIAMSTSSDPAVLEMILHRLDGIQSEVTAIKESQGAMQSEVAGIKQEVAGIKQEVAGIKESQGAMQSEVAGIKQEVAGITGIKQEVAGIKESQGAMQSEVKDLRKDINMFVQPLHSMRAVPEDAATATAKGTEWKNQELLHYDLQETGAYCAVLSQVCEVKPADAASLFPAVAEHIVPQGQAAVASNWGFHYTDKRNGIFLLRDLELKYQAGRFSLIPVEPPKNDSVRLRVWVSNELKSEPICDKRQGTREQVRGVLRGSYYRQPLTFGVLDRCVICLKPAPYMRALFLKADMAHKKCPELPNPFDDDVKSRYIDGCHAMKEELIRRLLESHADTALPV